MGRCDGFHAEIRALQREGFRAIGFANPLRDLVGDSTYLAEFLRTLTGSIVLVGHSYGGNVISAAATGNDQVKALVYLNGWLGILGETLDGGDRKAVAKLADLRGELDGALTELRELVQGLDPPLLASDGLYAALSAAARRAGMRVTVDGNDVGRAPRSIESAVYFGCLEAIQNSAKHGGPGARASVRLTAQDGLLAFPRAGRRNRVRRRSRSSRTRAD